MCRHHCFQVWGSRVCIRVGGIVEGELLGDIHPYGFLIESVFVGIESTEGRVAL